MLAVVNSPKPWGFREEQEKPPPLHPPNKCKYDIMTRVAAKQGKRVVNA